MKEKEQLEKEKVALDLSKHYTEEEKKELEELEKLVIPRRSCRRCYGRGHVGRVGENFVGDKWRPTGEHVACSCIKKALLRYQNRRGDINAAAAKRVKENEE